MILVWMYNVNTMMQNFQVIENNNTEKFFSRTYMTIEEGINYIPKLIDQYKPEKIIIKGNDFNSLEYSNELKIRIMNKIYGQIWPTPKIEVIE